MLTYRYFCRTVNIFIVEANYSLDVVTYFFKVLNKLLSMYKYLIFILQVRS